MGRVLSGGADWQIFRHDGIIEVKAQYTLETHDGPLICAYNWGLRHGPKEVMEGLPQVIRVTHVYITFERV